MPSKKYLHNDDIFYEGDFREPRHGNMLMDTLGTTTSTLVGGLYAYRGLRGAGWYPGSSNFWKPLSRIQDINIIDAFRKTGISDALVESTPAFTAAIKREAASGFGLSTMSEGMGRLMSRSVEGIPSVLEFLGVPEKMIEKSRVIPRKILGGDITRELGISRATPELREKLLAGFSKKGIKPVNLNAFSALGKVAAFSALAYAATLGFNYLDYRLRKSNKLDKTPLREGITGAIATGWVNLRKGTQKVLEKTGISSVHNYLEDLMPGYLTVAGMLAGTALGVKQAAKFNGKGASLFLRQAMSVATKAHVFGIAGYAAEKGLSYDSDRLENIYSGKEKLPVRKGRWWEFGRTPYEGSRIQYYRQHWYPLMMSKYSEKGGLYQSEDWKWENHWLFGIPHRIKSKKSFDPYAWEKQHYKERPYPITRGVFENFPVIGPTLEATIGRFLKPRKYMHTEDWLSGSGIVKQPDERETIRGVPSDASERLGLSVIPSAGMGEVVSPLDLRNVAGEQQQRLGYWMGLPGFIMKEAWRKSSGKQSLFETAVLQSPERAMGFERAYEDRELGGLAGTSEIFRRFFPHRRKQVPEYNPIPNLMGKTHSWLPGPEYFIDFKHGDPFIKVPLGEARLPGKGYEALNELHSNIPGVYDAMDRFLILADVAPYSDEYKNYRTIVGMWARSGIIDRAWEDKYEETLENRKSTLRRNNFYERRFSGSKDLVEGSLSQINEGHKTSREYSGLERGIGRAWENLTHTMSNAPIPMVSWLTSKHIHQRTALEHYERYEVLGRESGSWSNPIRDFLGVYATEAAGKINKEYIPKEVGRRRDVEEYFDRLKYVKYRQLESMAKIVGDSELAMSLKQKQKETMFGVDPYGSWKNIYRAMPKRERDYFETFRTAKGEDRSRIRQLVSDDIKRMYEAQWSITDATSGVESDAVQQKKRNDSELEDFFAEKYLPGPNWIGWHPDVSMDRVKLKVVKNEAMDMFDFNLWQEDERALEREPIPLISNYSAPNPQYDSPEIRRSLLKSLVSGGVMSPSIEITSNPSVRSEMIINMDLDSDKSDDYIKTMGRRAYMMAR